MIEATNLSKKFGDFSALSNVSLTINDGSIFGLIGTNGAGKSTFLRILTGIYTPDEGDIIIDGTSVINNTAVKNSFFFISDDSYYFPNATPKDLCSYFSKIYPNFDKILFRHLLDNFDLGYNRKVATFSKGMKKQLSIIAALSANTKYIFCDETFDGLDPVMRQGIKSLFAAATADRNLTTIIASHNLRELEDISDHIGLLHKGGVILSKDLEDMKINFHKVQVIFPAAVEITDFPDLDIVTFNKRGSLSTIVVRGEEEKILATIEKEKPIFLEALPLTLEEVFINETEVKGYDIKKLII